MDAENFLSFELSAKTIKIARPFVSSRVMSSKMVLKYSSYDPFTTMVSRALSAFLAKVEGRKVRWWKPYCESSSFCS
jgi:hypothetical protein